MVRIADGPYIPIDFDIETGYLRLEDLQTRLVIMCPAEMIGIDVPKTKESTRENTYGQTITYKLLINKEKTGLEFIKTDADTGEVLSTRQIKSSKVEKLFNFINSRPQLRLGDFNAQTGYVRYEAEQCMFVEVKEQYMLIVDRNLVSNA